jgi:hypothetical protein
MNTLLNMKKKILIILVILITAIVLFVSCTHDACPTYGGRTTSGQFSNSPKKIK